METEELKKRIEERKQDAQKKQFAKKAEAITKYFGVQSTSYGSSYVSHTYTFRSQEQQLEISYTPTSYSVNTYISVSIKYAGGEVYNSRTTKGLGSSTTDVYGYLPGIWEQSFEGLYQKALVKEQELNSGKTKLEAQAKSFGISL